MGFYFRKSVRVGLFRFNLSGSGIGVSFGIPGLRIGTGPRGNYISAGRGGIYYRQTLPRTGRYRSTPAPNFPGTYPPHAPQGDDGTVGEFRKVDAGAAAQMQDSSSQGLLDDLNDKHRRMALLPWCVGLLIITACASVFSQVPTRLFVSVTIGLLLLTVFAAFRDSLKKTAVLVYDLDADVTQAFANLHAAFIGTSKCRCIWHVSSRADVLDRKYHAGASSMIDTEKIQLTTAPPPKVRTNAHPLTVSLGTKTVYFFPDRLLVLDGTGFGAVGYDHLRLELGESKYILGGEAVPSDARVVDYTWKYVNKGGGPDRRFHPNPQIPVIATATLRIASPSGLNGVLMFSNTQAVSYFVDEFHRLNSLPTAPPPKEAAPASRRRKTEKPLFCWIQEQVCGPYTPGEIQQMLAQGTIGGNTLACPPEQQDWRPVADFL